MGTDRNRDQNSSDPADSHTHLRDLFEDISRRLSQRNLSQTEVLDAFHGLRTELIEHFRHEESCGYFGDAVDLAPRLKLRADALLQQHPDLEERLDRLHAVATQGPPSDAWWHAVTEEFASFYDAFDRHERSETALLQEAYNRDVGTDD